MRSVSFALIAALASGLAAAQTPPSPPPDGAPPDSAQRQAMHQKMLAACDADIKSFCADQTGHGVMKCLRSNSAQLSASCKSAMPPHHPHDGAPPPAPPPST